MPPTVLWVDPGYGVNIKSQTYFDTSNQYGEKVKKVIVITFEFEYFPRVSADMKYHVIKL